MLCILLNVRFSTDSIPSALTKLPQGEIAIFRRKRDEWAGGSVCFVGSSVALGMGRIRSVVPADGRGAAESFVRGVPDNEDDEDDEEQRKDEEDEEDEGEGYSE